MAALRVWVVLAVFGSGALVAGAAEIELRRECRASKGVVTLGDVAVIHSTDAREAEAMAAAELFPSPPPGQQRFLRVGELQDLLLLRGFALAQHRMTGSSQVAIHGAEIRVEANVESLSPSLLRKAERIVSDAAARCLQQASGKSETRDVTIQLDDAQARAVTKALGDVSVRGGAPPWVGRQVFEVTAGSGAKAERFTVEAAVAMLPSVVVTAHALARGSVIGAADVRLEPVGPDTVLGDCFHTIEEVVGGETTQSVGEGEAIMKRVVRAPLLVHRGEIVTVYARAAGIYVRTVARVRQEGSLGDLVSAESLADRKSFIARVCGIRELEVFARSAQAESTAARPMGASAQLR